MDMRRRIYSLLALLVWGSASLMAQTDDPFPAVNYNKYQDNMTFFGQVRMGGKIQPDGTIVAAYCGDEIRGKGTVLPKQGRHEHCVRFVICGEKKGAPLHFKVFTNGRIIEVDQGAIYVTNDRLGSVSEYYFIDLPEPVVTTPSTEGWATTCLPFNAEVPEGVVVWNATGIENGALVMTKLTGKILPKNMPVLLESTGKTSYEWLSRVADGDMAAEGSIFLGTTEPTTVDANSVLTLGHSDGNGEIGFWRFTGTTIPANRAYIASFPAGAKGLRIVMDDTTTGITRTSNGEGSSCWYTLGGTRLSHQPTAKGVYVNNGRKVVIK